MSTPHCPDRKELAHVSATGPSPHGNGDPTVFIPDSWPQKDGQSPVATGEMSRSLVKQGVDAKWRKSVLFPTWNCH